MVTCKIKHFTTFLRPQHSRGKSTALKHFCKCFILHVTMKRSLKVFEFLTIPPLCEKWCSHRRTVSSIVNISITYWLDAVKAENCSGIGLEKCCEDAWKSLTSPWFYFTQNTGHPVNCNTKTFNPDNGCRLFVIFLCFIYLLFMCVLFCGSG